MRCFVAIRLPEPVLDDLERLQQELPAGRASPRGNLHLTLKFLGEVPEPQVGAVHAALSGIESERIALDIVGLDLFGGRSPKILFAGVRPHDPLLGLHRRVVRAARAAGLDLRRERYRPHVTLARFNRSLRRDEEARLAAFLQANGTFSTGPFEAKNFTLLRSDLGKGPAVHTALASYPLTPTGE